MYEIMSRTHTTTTTTTTPDKRITRAKTKTAYVTMIANDAFVPGVLMLYHSLNATNSLLKRKKNNDNDDNYYSYHDFVILETSQLSNNAIYKLQSTIPSCIILRHDTLERIDRENSDVFIDRYKGEKSWMMFSKLNIFNLVNYQRIVYLDADILVLKDISHLLQLELEDSKDATATTTTTTTMTTPPTSKFSLSACPEKIGLEPEFNAGFLVIQNPTQDVFVDMKSHVNDTNYNCGYRATDQSFLCHYFHPTHGHHHATTITTTINTTNAMGLTRAPTPSWAPSANRRPGHPPTSSEDTSSRSSSSTWSGIGSTTWDPLPREYMAYYKVIDKRNWHSIYNTYHLLHFNGDKPWLLLLDDANANVNANTTNNNDTSLLLQQQYNPHKILYKKNEVLKHWYLIALEECGENCYFENYLTQSKIQYFLTIYPPLLQATAK